MRVLRVARPPVARRNGIAVPFANPIEYGSPAVASAREALASKNASSLALSSLPALSTTVAMLKLRGAAPYDGLRAPCAATNWVIVNGVGVIVCPSAHVDGKI